jgi:hypothetical protein
MDIRTIVETNSTGHDFLDLTLDVKIASSLRSLEQDPQVLLRCIAIYMRLQVKALRMVLQLYSELPTFGMLLAYNATEGQHPDSSPDAVPLVTLGLERQLEFPRTDPH